MHELKDKVVLITGGSTGIGAKVIEFLLEENVKHIANLDVAEEKGMDLQNYLNKKYGVNKVKFIRGDVTNEKHLSAAYETTVKEQGYIDIVLNNAGVMNDSREKYKKEIEVNVTALITSTIKAMDLMRKDEGGRGGVIMNMSSIAALLQNSRFPIYYATKSAVLQFSNCVGLPDYYNRTGVRVIAMCFGATDTSLLTRHNLGSFDKEMDEMISVTLKTISIQTVESAARGVIEALKRGSSGSTWIVQADRPAVDISETIKKAYSIMTDVVIN